jgi:hypothetical protein
LGLRCWKNLFSVFHSIDYPKGAELKHKIRRFLADFADRPWLFFPKEVFVFKIFVVFSCAKPHCL